MKKNTNVNQGEVPSQLSMRRPTQKPIVTAMTNASPTDPIEPSVCIVPGERVWPGSRCGALEDIGSGFGLRITGFGGSRLKPPEARFHRAAVAATAPSARADNSAKLNNGLGYKPRRSVPPRVMTMVAARAGFMRGTEPTGSFLSHM